MVLIFALKEGKVANLVFMVKVEKKLGKDCNSPSNNIKGKAHAHRDKLAVLTRGVGYIGRVIYHWPLEPLHLYIAHLEVEYGGSTHDQMQSIQDF